MDITTTATFALAFLVFAASPGPDNITIVSKTVNDGPAHGIAYGCGVVASIAGVVVLAALGLNVLAGAVGDHLRLVRYLGAAYLAPAAASPQPRGRRPDGRRRRARRGALTPSRSRPCPRRPGIPRPRSAAV